MDIGNVFFKILFIILASFFLCAIGYFLFHLTIFFSVIASYFFWFMHFLGFHWEVMILFLTLAVANIVFSFVKFLKSFMN